MMGRPRSYTVTATSVRVSLATGWTSTRRWAAAARSPAAPTRAVAMRYVRAAVRLIEASRVSRPKKAFLVPVVLPPRPQQPGVLCNRSSHEPAGNSAAPGGRIGRLRTICPVPRRPLTLRRPPGVSDPVRLREHPWNLIRLIPAKGARRRFAASLRPCWERRNAHRDRPPDRAHPRLWRGLSEIHQGVPRRWPGSGPGSRDRALRRGAAPGLRCERPPGVRRAGGPAAAPEGVDRRTRRRGDWLTGRPHPRRRADSAHAPARAVPGPRGRHPTAFCPPGRDNARDGVRGSAGGTPRRAGAERGRA